MSTGRPRKSVVWEYFEYDLVREKSICQVLKSPTLEDGDTSDICGQAISGKFPTNLKQHLKKVHPEQHSELMEKEETKSLLSKLHH